MTTDWQQPIEQAEQHAAHLLGATLAAPGEREPILSPDTGEVTTGRRRSFTEPVCGPRDLALVGIITIDYPTDPRTTLLLTWPGNTTPTWLGVRYPDAADTIDLLCERLCPDDPEMAAALRLWLVTAWARAAGPEWLDSDTTALTIALGLARHDLDHAPLHELATAASTMVGLTERLQYLTVARSCS